MFYAASTALSFNGLRQVGESLAQTQIRSLKIQSLLFEKIHFARTHLLTSYNEQWSSYVRRVLQDEFFMELVNRGAIEVSARSGTDARSDTDRIISRLKQGNIFSLFHFERSAVPLEVLHAAGTQIANYATENRYIHERLRSLLNSASIQEKSFADAAQEIVKRSEGHDVPFLHELFLGLGYQAGFKSEHPRWEEFVRTSNSLYIENGVSTEGDMIANFDNNLEPEEAAIDRGIDRRIYSDQVISYVISRFVGFNKLEGALQGSTKHFLHYRDTRDGEVNWRAFMDAYYIMAKAVTDKIVEQRLLQGIVPLNITMLIEGYLAGSLDDMVNSLVALSGVVGTAGLSAYDPTMGMLSRGGAGFVKQILRRPILNIIKAASHPDISAFCRLLTK